MTAIANPSNTRAAGTSLLEPHILQKISKMEMVAHQVMDGYVQGMHKSPHIGFALDFAQHRQYVPGDDVKRIDWRVFAKSERYYIKQYEVTTNLRCHLVLDASGSMGYQGPGDVMSKFRYGQFLAAAISYIVLHQQDSIGLITFDNKVRSFIPPRSSPAQLLRIVRTLDDTKAERESGISPLLHEVAERIARRSMVVVISDLFDDADKLIEALHHLRHKRHEVILMQTMASDELEFPFRKWSLFENLENTSDRLKLDPAMMRNVYLENVARHLEKIRDAVAKMRIHHLLLNTSQPFDEALMIFLAQRAGRR
ncbi:MAG TPA: DUF58 domain-containing protein [Tepidisphaeraceae bacterium]|jgi:uncharacterized protein (DUF58 family)|nr:DUF58 domain-containing protein [Tepidisphaeraceae bacterium]